MRKSISARVAAAAVLAFAAGVGAGAGPALADETGIYVGAGVTQSQIDHIFGFGSHLRIDDTAWKGFVGFKVPLLPLGV